jgi:hypothetical protein
MIYDATELNQWDVNPFTFEHKQIEEVVEEGRLVQSNKTRRRRITLPSVNCTEIEKVLDWSWERPNGEYERIKQRLGIKGVYPRWIGYGNITRDLGINGNI